MGKSILFIISLIFSFQGITSPIGKKNQIPFSQSLPEDVSNENFPDEIESFDYPNADLLDLIKAVGKLTGLNFIIAPGITSKKITIVAPSKITVAEAYKAFLSALAINSLTLVKSGAFWKIQETKKALKDNTEIYSSGYFPNTDQLITRIIKLQYINAKEFSSSIKYLLSQDNQISHHESSNSIIVSDYGSVIERLMKIVQEMDVPGSEENVEIIPIQHAAAKDLSEILNRLLNKTSSLSSSRFKRTVIPSKSRKKDSGNDRISNIIPDERTNSLVISANKSGMKRVKKLIQKLDTYVDPSRTGGIYVYNVLYGTAEQVYQTLMGINPSPTPTSRFQLRRGSKAKSSSSSSPLFQNVTIMADTNTNSLIISARNKFDFEKVKAVLKKIDVPKDQVFVQAIIVELSVSKGDQWEINLAKALDKGFGQLIGFDSGTVPLAGFLNRSLSPNLNTLQKSGVGPGFVLGLPFSDLLKSAGLKTNLETKNHNELSLSMFNKSYTDLSQTEQDNVDRSYNSINSSPSVNQGLNQALNLSMFPILQVLKKAGNINILSTPQITALDNVKASIEVGENAPVGLTSTATAGTGVLNSVDREDITLRLEITPRINPDSGTVQMDISQKFDDFSAKQSTASELQSRGVHVVKRNIETKLVLHDGETAVLGGLMTDKEVKNENKVPILGDIPILGWLFKGSTIEKEKRNLLVFITPTIIKGKNQKNQVRQLLGKKLEERIHFIKKNMKGEDPHGSFLKRLTAKQSLNEETENSEETPPPKKDSTFQEITPLKPPEADTPAPTNNPLESDKTLIEEGTGLIELENTEQEILEPEE